MSRTFIGPTGALALTLVFALPSGAAARSRGITGRSGQWGSTCSACHGGGATPTVVLDGPAMLETGQSGTFELTLSGGQEAGGGLDVAADGGALAVHPDETTFTKLVAGELVHSRPKEGASLSWLFEWTAPDAPGTYTLFAAGNSVNLNGSTSGDASVATTLAVTVSEPVVEPDVVEPDVVEPDVAAGDVGGPDVGMADDTNPLDEPAEEDVAASAPDVPVSANPDSGAGAGDALTADRTGAMADAFGDAGAAGGATDNGSGGGGGCATAPVGPAAPVSALPVALLSLLGLGLAIVRRSRHSLSR